MNELALEYPAYHWLDNKGYPTKVHREAIRTHGITPYHRKTFTLFTGAAYTRFFNTYIGITLCVYTYEAMPISV